MVNRSRSISLKHLFCVFLLLLVFQGSTEASTFPESRSDLRLPFIANDGQVDTDVAFYADITGGTVFVTTDGGIVYSMKGDPDFVLREVFTRSLPNRVMGSGPAEAVVNFYQGSDTSKWHESVKTWREVSLGRKYPDIDVDLIAAAGTVEKVFTVYPGGDVSDIKCRIEDAKALDVDDSGHLLVSATTGNFRFTKPLAYQLEDGKRIEVEAAYRLEENVYGFTLGDYDRTLPLIIDPLLASTYLGGASNETTFAVETSSGDIIVAGTSDSREFPGVDGKMDVLGDAFVLRLDHDLNAIRAATFFGGSMTEGVRDLVVGGGSIYAAGYNNSLNFPATSGAAYSGTELSGAFVVKMDPSTLRIIAATSFLPNVFGLAWSPAGKEVFIAGSTGNTDFPIPVGNTPAFQVTHKGRADSFVAVFDEDLTLLKGATLLGGEGFDIIYDLTVDDHGYPVAVGVTNSAAFPVSDNAFGPAYNLDWEATHLWIDGFVARFTPDLGSLESATYLGGGLNDNITAVAAQRSLVLVGGNTASADFPCGSTFGPVDGNDAFVVLLSEDLTRIVSCTVFGGSRPGTESPESVSGLGFHPSGSIFAVGRTNASDFPTTPGAFLERPSGSYFGAFIIAFNQDMSQVEASTLVHGNSEALKAVAFDSWGDVVVAGDSSSGGYPVTQGAFQPEYAGGDDLVVSRFSPDLAGPHMEVLSQTVDFGQLAVGTERFEEIVFYNSGGSDLNIKSIQLVPGALGEFDLDNSCTWIPAFGSCSMEAVFRPLSTGSKKAELTIGSNDHFKSQVTINLTGRGTNSPPTNPDDNMASRRNGPIPPVIKLLPNPLEFGDVEIGKTATRMLKVLNAGGGGLGLDRVYLDEKGVDIFRIGSDTCSGALLKGTPENPDSAGYCEVEIMFSPKSTNEAIASFNLTSSEPFSAVHTVLVKGRGVDPDDPGYPGFWGWVAILVLVLRMVLGVPVSARGWGKWISRRDKR